MHQSQIAKTGLRADKNQATIACSMGQKVKPWGESKGQGAEMGQQVSVTSQSSPLSRQPVWTPCSSSSPHLLTLTPVFPLLAGCGVRPWHPSTEEGPHPADDHPGHQ